MPVSQAVRAGGSAFRWIVGIPRIGGIRALTEALVTNPSGRWQQAGKLLTTVAATYTGLESEAPGPLKAAFAKVAQAPLDVRHGGLT